MHAINVFHGNSCTSTTGKVQIRSEGRIESEGYQPVSVLSQYSLRTNHQKYNAHEDFHCSLNVLRAVIADTSNASKSATPFKSDLQVLALLRKRSASSRSAADEFAAAKRADLKEKEEAQIAVLEEYASQVETIDKQEIEQAVRQTMAKLRSEGASLNIGSVMKAVSGAGGPLDGRPAEKGDVALAVKEALSNSS